MNVLRLTQTSPQPGTFHVHILLQIPGHNDQTADSDFAFSLSDEQQERFRWYLEDFLQYPHDPAPAVAARVEAEIADIGKELFQNVFSSADALKIWARIQEQFNDTRIEITTSVAGAVDIPWELIRDPDNDVPLALRAHAFVRIHTNPSQPVAKPKTTHPPIRILLVICRPAKDPLPFRSDAMTILKGIDPQSRQTYQLDVLRPPTFAQLSHTLEIARDENRSYHVVHFDGHGGWLDVKKLKMDRTNLISTPRDGPHGYLLFENPNIPDDQQFIDGPALGRILAQNKVPLLILNACRSAHADLRTAPATDAGDSHALTRAYGTLAQEVIDQGVPSVIAMRYSVYVATGVRFLKEFYEAVARGLTTGHAAALGRQHLFNDPTRDFIFENYSLQDWTLPIVYESSPLQLCRSSSRKKPKFTLEKIPIDPGNLDPDLPRPPDTGFIGRDETLLALDRAFDSQPVVLLHAYAGSGKTAAASEFARWYSITGGLPNGIVLFNKFEQYTPLSTVLAHFGQIFAPILEQSGINWSAIIDTNQRKALALQLLNKIPVLWVWDNIEPVTGFPKGSDTPWSKDEQQELLDFLRDAAQTRAKFLLTSRRAERDWLGNLPARIPVPPMPMTDRVLLARALAEKHQRRLTDVEDWRPLLEFTRGNPLTLTVLVNQALRDKLTTQDQIVSFVSDLRTGQADFADEDSEGRSQSLAASLNYGFLHTFNDSERKILALLHFFQGSIDVNILQAMGHEKADWSLPELKGMSHTDLIPLLDRVAEIGLLTPYGKGYYFIHPALPWFFQNLFHENYPVESEDQTTALHAARAFTKAIGYLGNYYWRKYVSGNRDVILALTAEEKNLLHARHLARQNQWWALVICTMQSIDQLYCHIGRNAEWQKLVNEIVPDFVDPATQGPLNSREDNWSIVTQYRVRIVRQKRNWPQAEKLQRLLVDFDRQRAQKVLITSPENLNPSERNDIRSLAVSLHELAQIQREKNQSQCVDYYTESLNLAERINDKSAAAICAFNLGNAYKDITEIRDFDLAEKFYQYSLDLCDKIDQLGKSRCLSQLGFVAWERFKEARNDHKSESDIVKHFHESLHLSLQALDMRPENAVHDLAVSHQQIGIIFDNTGNLDRALNHYREAIRLFENEGDIYHTGTTRFKIAAALYDAQRFHDALDYAQAALKNFQRYGQSAADDIQQT